MPTTSAVTAKLPESGIRKIFERVSVLERQGRRVIRFDIGQPDEPSPAWAVAEAKAALDRGLTRYAPNRGIAELRQALARKLHRETGVHYDPDTEIVVTTGASEAVAATMFALLDRDADALIPEPLWPHYAVCARMAGAGVIAMPLSLADGFAISEPLLQAHCTGRTRLVVMNNPVNPTGIVYERQALDEVLRFAQARDLWILADEMYDQFTYGSGFCPFASLPAARERTLIVNGFSKSYGMTGWRLGYVAGPAAAIAQVNKVHQYLTVCATSFAQYGAVAACDHPEGQARLNRLRQEYSQRNRAMVEEAARLPGLRFHAPHGAFYLFAELPAWMGDAETAAARFLDEAGVAVVPGNAFGAAYRRFIRISYGTNPVAEIRDGMGRLAEILAAHRMAA